MVRSLVLLEPWRRGPVLERPLGQLRMEWLEDRHRRQTCGNVQELEVHPDDRLKRKQTGPLFGCWREESALGQSLWLWYGLEQIIQWGLARPEKVTVQSSKSTWSQLIPRS